MKDLAKPKVFDYNKIVKLSKHWALYIGFHKSFHTKSLQFDWRIKFAGSSHRGLTVFIQVWDRYFEFEITDDYHVGMD